MMSNSISTQETVFQFPWGRTLERNSREQLRHDALTAELQAAHAREKAWLREKSDLLRRQDILAQEFEHRLVNSLQIIVSLLSLQSRTASPDAAAQLIRCGPSGCFICTRASPATPPRSSGERGI